MRSLAILALLLTACAQPIFAAAGQAYTVTIEQEGDSDRTKTFHVVASGDRLRVVHVDAPPGEGVMYDALLRTGSSGVVALNSRNRTWYAAPQASPFALRSNYLTPMPPGTVKKASVKFEPAGAHRYTGEMRYDVLADSDGYRVKISCHGIVTVVTTGSIARHHWLGRILPTTGFPAVDLELSAAEAKIEGFPVSISLEVKRTYAGGAPMVDSMKVEVSDVREIAVDDSEFVRPADYQMQEPVLGFPGVSSK